MGALSRVPRQAQPRERLNREMHAIEPCSGKVRAIDNSRQLEQAVLVSAPARHHCRRRTPLRFSIAFYSALVLRTEGSFRALAQAWNSYDRTC